MSPPAQDATPRPKRFRRRTWAIYVVVFLFVVMAFWVWVGLQVHQAQRQRLAAEAITQLGGAAYYEYQVEKRGHFLDPNPELGSPHPRWLRKVLGEDVLAYVAFVDLARRPAVNDGALAHLREMPQLRVVHLEFTDVSDAGLAHISSLDRLEHLLLASPRITSAGLIHLKALKRLKVLWLLKAEIRDEDLSQLAHLGELEVLVVSSSKISQRAADDFMRRRSGCEVVRQR